MISEAIKFLANRLAKPVGRKTERWFNPSLIRVEDFRNVRSLSKKLQQSRDPLSQHLRSIFSPEDRAKLNAYLRNPESNRKFPKYLAAVFNEILRGQALYDEKRFRRNDLSDETISLLDQELANKDLVRLNRLLLEEGYPREIARGYFPRRLKWAIPILCSLSIAAIVCWGLKAYDYLAARPKDPSRYGFEETSRPLGWETSKDAARGTALSNPGRSLEQKVKGNYSLSVHVDLDGTEEGRIANRHQGEVLVDCTFNRPVGYPEPIRFVDLSNKTVSASIIVPTNQLVGKDPSSPIYAQIFLETCNPPIHRFDLPAKNITSSGQMDLASQTNASMNDICRIGIKIGLSQQDANKYSGDIYVDVINW